MATSSLARSFETIGAEYDRFRPGFPGAVAELIIPENVPLALDLGAGTGKFTEHLVSRAEIVLAVEPSDAMRAVLIDKLPEVRAVAGTAEQIPVEAGTVSVVTVAQAFHWFDREKATAEIHRILTPGGTLALLWNHADPECVWDRACSRVLFSALGEASVATASATADLPGFVLRRHQEISWSEQIRREGYLRRWSTVSTFLVASPAERAEYMRQMNTVLDEDPETAGRTVFTLPQVTDVYIYSARDTTGAPPPRE